jgi:hypothetical protein
MLRHGVNNHTPQKFQFHVRVLRTPGMEEIVPQVKIRSIPMQALHRVMEGRDVQDPHGVRLYSSRS